MDKDGKFYFCSQQVFIFLNPLLQVTGSHTTELDNGARRVRIQPAYRGILDVFAKVYRESGLRGLYRGVGRH